MKLYPVYLFDFDYTLADSANAIVMCFQYVLTLHGYTGVTDDAIKRTIGKTLEESFTILTGESSPEVLRTFRSEYVAKADVVMNDHTHFFPETIDVLQSLKQQGAHLGIISTKYRYRIQDFIERSLPADFFDVIVGGEDVAAPKPSPQGIHKALDKLDTEADSCLYVGDSIVDAQTAMAAKMDFAGVLHGATQREELIAFPHVRIMNSLTELLPH